VDRDWRAVVAALLRVLSSAHFDSETIAGQQRLLRRLVEAEREVAAAAAARAGLVALYPAARATVRPPVAYAPVAPSALEAFRREVVRPNRLTLVVSGPVPPEEVKRQVADATADWVPGPDPGPAPDPGPPPRTGPFRIEMVADESAVWVGCRGPRPDEEDYAAAVLGMEALARGMGARLFRRLRDDLGLVYGATGQVVAAASWPYMYVLATCEEGQAARVTAEIRAELAKLAAEELSSRELERARRLAGIELLRLRMSNWEAAQYLSSLAAIAPLSPASSGNWRLLDDLQGVGPARLRAFFERWWSHPTVVQVLGRPAS